MAAENLKAAEMHDMAHELMNRAEVMEKELHAAKEELAHAIKAHGPEKGEEIHKLRNENELLRAELNELRKVVEELRQTKKSNSPSERSTIRAGVLFIKEGRQTPLFSFSFDARNASASVEVNESH